MTVDDVLKVAVPLVGGIIGWLQIYGRDKRMRDHLETLKLAKETLGPQSEAVKAAEAALEKRLLLMHTAPSTALVLLRSGGLFALSALSCALVIYFIDQIKGQSFWRATLTVFGIAGWTLITFSFVFGAVARLHVHFRAMREHGKPSTGQKS